MNAEVYQRHPHNPDAQRQVLPEEYEKAKLDLSEFMVMCRQQGYFNLNDIQMAIFEFNGKLSILPVSGKRPVNPSGMTGALAIILLSLEGL